MPAPPPLKLPEYLSIVPAFADSTGNVVGAPNAIYTGPRCLIEERVLDSKARRRDIAIINDAEHARGTLQSIRQREREVAAREDAVAAREEALLQQAIQKLDASAAKFTQRMDALEAERAHDPDDDELPLPPGIPMGDQNDVPSPSHDDDGHLQSPIEAPLEAEA